MRAAHSRIHLIIHCARFIIWDMPNAYLVSSLEKGPQIVKWIVDHADPEVYDRKTDPDRFTFREVIAHLSDWEPIVLGRLKQAKEHPGSTLVAFDEGQRAIDHDYASTDPIKEVEKWTASRTKTIQFLTEEAPGYWELAGVHPQRGVLTIYDLANFAACHDTYHVEQLLRFLK